METREEELNRLLAMLAERVDLDHCSVVEDRYEAVFNHESVDVPVLVIQSGSMFGSSDVLPQPWGSFRYYSYTDAFYDPVAMMQNQLLDRVVPGILLKDDNPLSLRNNHGGIQIASVLGAEWNIYEDNFPWVHPIADRSMLEEIAYSTEQPTQKQGGLPRAFETLELYKHKLAQYPPLSAAVQISVPDLQGPMDTAEQIWGSSIYYAFYDAQDLLGNLLERIVEVMLTVFRWFQAYSTDRLLPNCATQHGYMVPGQFLIRDDSSLPLSPSMYEDFVSRHDARLADAFGRISIHSCGNWDHLVEKFAGIPGVVGLDPGNPEMMDIGSAYRFCRDRGIAITAVRPNREDLMSGKASRDFPTGVVFVYKAENYNDAETVVRAYYRR